MTANNYSNLLSKKAIVIGANGGIGSAVAMALAKNGIDLALVGRNEAAISRIADNCIESGCNAIPLTCDIARVDTIEPTVNTAIEQLGGLNFLLNCAGISASEGLAAAMFEDEREFGTKVCTIKPGWVNTPLVKTESINPALMIQPADIAQTVLFVLSMPDTACPTEITILPQRSPYI